jgi:hypothetical protein
VEALAPPAAVVLPQRRARLGVAAGEELRAQDLRGSAGRRSSSGARGRRRRTCSPPEPPQTAPPSAHRPTQEPRQPLTPRMRRATSAASLRWAPYHWRSAQHAARLRWGDAREGALEGAGEGAGEGERRVKGKRGTAACVRRASKVQRGCAIATPPKPGAPPVERGREERREPRPRRRKAARRDRERKAGKAAVRREQRGELLWTQAGVKGWGCADAHCNPQMPPGQIPGHGAHRRAPAPLRASPPAPPCRPLTPWGQGGAGVHSLTQHTK